PAVLVLPSEEEAQLGVPVPGAVTGRAGVKYRLPGDPRLLPSPPPGQGVPEYTPGARAYRALRVERDDPLVLVEGLVVSAPELQTLAEGDAGERVGGVEADGRIKMIDRLVVQAPARQGIGERHVRPNGSRIEG